VRSYLFNTCRDYILGCTAEKEVPLDGGQENKISYIYIYVCKN